MKKIFISYSHRDLKTHELVEELKSRVPNITYWLSPEDKEVWQSNIIEQLNHSSIFVYFDNTDDKNRLFELGYASGQNKKIILVGDNKNLPTDFLNYPYCQIEHSGTELVQLCHSSLADNQPNHLASTQLEKSGFKTLNSLVENVELIDKMPAIIFEELVQNWFENCGLEVEIPRPLNDKSYDFAVRLNEKSYVFIAIKKLNHNAKLSLTSIREFIEFLNLKENAKAIVVSTSPMTNAAKCYVEQLELDLMIWSLKDLLHLSKHKLSHKTQQKNQNKVSLTTRILLRDVPFKRLQKIATKIMLSIDSQIKLAETASEIKRVQDFTDTYFEINHPSMEVLANNSYENTSFYFFVENEQRDIVGAACLTIDSPSGLPEENVFAPALQNYRRKRKNCASLHQFQIAKPSISKKQTTALSFFALFYQFSKLIGVDILLALVRQKDLSLHTKAFGATTINANTGYTYKGVSEFASIAWHLSQMTPKFFRLTKCEKIDKSEAYFRHMLELDKLSSYSIELQPDNYILGNNSIKNRSRSIKLDPFKVKELAFIKGIFSLVDFEAALSQFTEENDSQLASSSAEAAWKGHKLDRYKAGKIASFLGYKDNLSALTRAISPWHDLLQNFTAKAPFSKLVFGSKSEKRSQAGLVNLALQEQKIVDSIPIDSQWYIQLTGQPKEQVLIIIRSLSQLFLLAPLAIKSGFNNTFEHNCLTYPQTKLFEFSRSEGLGWREIIIVKADKIPFLPKTIDSSFTLNWQELDLFAMQLIESATEIMTSSHKFMLVD